MMKPIHIIENDILDDLDPTPEEPVVILHGCNCFHTMGAGIAKYLSEKYPQVLNADKLTNYGVPEKLGTISVAEIQPHFHIVNCYTQFSYGSKGVYADYKAIRESLEEVARRYDERWRIRTVKIGCGLAKGNWDKVSSIMCNTFKNRDLTVYIK
jgi:O-acetyl-ADP-ribose deacetylase (regulator of RNase III)